MKKVAVLVDGSFLLIKLRGHLGREATAEDVYAFACSCVDPAEDEERFRIYYYDCEPYAESHPHPLTRRNRDFGNTRVFHARQRLLRELGIKPGVALRLGELSFDGWVVKQRTLSAMLEAGRSFVPADFEADLTQKRVDMKIGLDVAWLSSRRIVDRVVLVTADSDFVPAMKFARREGVQVVLVTLGHRQVKHDLLLHADELREVDFQLELAGEDEDPGTPEA